MILGARSLRGRRAALSLLLLVTCALPAQAQPDPWRAERPSFLRSIRGPLTIEGNAGFGPTALGFANGSVAHRIPFRLGGSSGRLEWGGLVGRSVSEHGEYGRLESRVLLDGSRSGLWLGAAGRYDRDRRGHQAPLLGTGAWVRAKKWVSSVGFEQTTDVLTHRDYVYSYAESAFVAVDHREPIRRSSLHAGFGWSHGRIALESVVGVSVSSKTGPRRWVRGSAAFTVWPGLSLVAAGGSSGPDLFGYPEQQHGQATLGFRLTPSWGDKRVAGHAASTLEWAVLRESEGWYSIEVRVEGARTVEITSDAIGWETMSLAHSGKDRWRARLRLEDGLYHVNLRIDGGPWIVPPGAPTVPDEFIGETGVLIIGS